MNELQAGIFDYNTLPSNDAIEVKAAAERIKIRLKRTAEDIIEIGRDLEAVKSRIGYKQAVAWSWDAFEMSKRSFDNFCSVFNTFGDASANFALIKPSALYALAAPSTPEEVRQQVIEKAESGETVSLKEIEELKRRIKEAEQAKQQAELEKHEAVGRLSGTQQLLDLMEQKYDEVRSKKEVIVEKEVETIPADYEHLKRYVEQLKQEKQSVQDKIDAIHAKYKDEVQKGVKDYLQSHQDELDDLERRKESLRNDFEHYRSGIAKFNARDVEMRSHQETIDAANLALASLAASISSFEFEPDDVLIRKWRTLEKNLLDAASAIKHMTSPKLEVVNG